jgi:hypothetical protein
MSIIVLFISASLDAILMVQFVLDWKFWSTFIFAKLGQTATHLSKLMQVILPLVSILHHTLSVNK